MEPFVPDVSNPVGFSLLYYMERVAQNLDFKRIYTDHAETVVHAIRQYDAPHFFAVRGLDVCNKHTIWLVNQLMDFLTECDMEPVLFPNQTLEHVFQTYIRECSMFMCCIDRFREKTTSFTVSKIEAHVREGAQFRPNEMITCEQELTVYLGFRGKRLGTSLMMPKYSMYNCTTSLMEALAIARADFARSPLQAGMEHVVCVLSLSPGQKILPLLKTGRLDYDEILDSYKNEIVVHGRVIIAMCEVMKCQNDLAPCVTVGYGRFVA